MQVALKVDVDTRLGMERGVPCLQGLLGERGIRATFFISFGPDHSGRALRRLFRPGFFAKMRRTRAARMYGFKTLLYGTLLPGPRIGAAFPDLLRSLAADGHEVGLHAWNHVYWHDRLPRLSEEAVRAEFGRGVAAYAEVFGHPLKSSAAPGWTCSVHSLAVQDEFSLAYCSDTRGETPFLPVLENRQFRTLQIPTTLPTLDEFLGTPELGDDNPGDYLLARLDESRLNVFTLHAETEGMGYAGFFADFLDTLRERGATFPRLDEMAAAFAHAPSPPPRHRLEQGTIPGRAGLVAVQGERLGS
jgi:peptidoglycan/xylan/chitin deacetylase (PgdA/CDA1 family)